ncbi:MAG: hypothetical protein KA205_06405 [Acidobacteria bacterium]|nr:hypothetical protein [Acidobacteriota bacterium]
MRSTVILLLLTYIVAVAACRWFVFGAIAMDGPTVTAMVAVPLVQAAAITGWRRIVGRRSRS